jgi:hypothetical protein
MAALQAGLKHVRCSPSSEGRLAWIVRRPQTDQREVLQAGLLSLEEGLVGDNWKTRGSKRTPDGSAHPEMQLNLINARFIALLAQEQERWQLAGDQFFIDLDLSDANLPPGTRLAIGEQAVIEITAQPHTGCAKFRARFGDDALRLVNSPEGRQLRLRGVNAKVIRPGPVQVGDPVRKL